MKLKPTMRMRISILTLIILSQSYNVYAQTIERIIKLNPQSSYGPTLYYDIDIDMDSDINVDLDRTLDPMPVQVIKLNVIPPTVKSELGNKVAQSSRQSNFQQFDQPANYQNYTRTSTPQKSNMDTMQVLNQGTDGACVTYATTGAMDVLHYNKTDHISQKCSLNLGVYLSSKDENFFQNHKIKHVQNIFNFAEAIGLEKFPDGWDGSFTYLVTSQISAYGIVPKSQESACGQPKTNTFSVTRNKLYAQHPLSDKNWQVICNHLEDRNCSPNSIQKVKKAIDDKKLVILSIRLTPHDSVYPYYEKNKQADQPNVWAYTKEIKDCIQHKDGACLDKDDIGGHAIIAYGYREHPTNPNDGVFYIRNSWGSQAGDRGGYFVTYRYLQNMMDSAVSLDPKS
jgi:aminopeptidase C